MKRRAKTTSAEMMNDLRLASAEKFAEALRFFHSKLDVYHVEIRHKRNRKRNR